MSTPRMDMSRGPRQLPQKDVSTLLGTVFLLKGGPYHHRRVRGEWLEGGRYTTRDGNVYQQLDFNSILHWRPWAY